MAVEFALIAPMLVVLIGGIIEFGILLFNQAVITNASREAARAGIVATNPGGRPTCSQMCTVANGYLTRAGLQTVSCCTTGTTNVMKVTNGTTGTTPNGACLAFGNDLTVSILYPYTLAFVVNIPRLGAATTMRCE
jgi:Flp pilus assembly protein TadG